MGLTSLLRRSDRQFLHGPCPLAPPFEDLPSGREFNKTEFADHAGVARQTVGNYIDLLLETRIVEEVPETSPQRYRVTESEVVRELYELDSALNAVVE